MAYKEILKDVYLFKEFTMGELEPIQELCKLDKFNGGDTVFHQGDEAKSLYIVQFGSVNVLQKGKAGDSIQVSLIGTKSHFGEMPFLDNERRSATVVASERSEILEIPYGDLRNYLHSNPVVAMKFYKNLASFLGGRLRITTIDLSFSREKNLHHF